MIQGAAEILAVDFQVVAPEHDLMCRIDAAAAGRFHYDDPDRAFNLIEGIENEGLRTKSIQGLFDHWRNLERDSAEEWLLRQESE